MFGFKNFIIYSLTFCSTTLPSKNRTVGAAVLEVKNGAAKLLDILVKEDFRAKGIGAQLLSEAEEKARGEGCRKISLETSKLHENALGFYTSRGYKLVVRIPKLYYEADWYVLSKEI